MDSIMAAITITEKGQLGSFVHSATNNLFEPYMDFLSTLDQVAHRGYDRLQMDIFLFPHLRPILLVTFQIDLLSISIDFGLYTINVRIVTQ
jgi:hypothetical protein